MSSGGVARRPRRKALTQYAMTDPAHCLVKGLFGSWGDGRPRLDVTMQYAGVHIQFRGAEALGPDDLRVLTAIVALAGRDGECLDAAAPGPPTLLLLDGPLPENASMRYIRVSLRARARNGTAGQRPDGGANPDISKARSRSDTALPDDRVRLVEPALGVCVGTSCRRADTGN